MTQEVAVAFRCDDATLIGVVHGADDAGEAGVVIVPAGGPQYRVGGHRQFLLLARKLAAHGHPALRFDYRGFGDSSGVFRGFQHIDEDIRAAVNALCSARPNIKSIKLVGECNAASAILLYAATDRRVTGVSLLNPWVRTDLSHARTYLKHYYTGRLRDPEFWRKLVTGKLNPFTAAGSLLDLLRKRFLPGTRAPGARGATEPLPFPERMLKGLQAFSGEVLLVLSDNDYIAREFEDVVGASPTWQRTLADPRVTRHALVGANHTFARPEWRDQVAEWILDWLRGDRGGLQVESDELGVEVADVRSGQG